MSVRHGFRPHILHLLIGLYPVAVLAGTLLPRLTQRDARLLAHDGDEDEDIEFARLKATVQEWRAEAARKGEPLKLPFMPFFLRNIWTGAMLLFAAITLSTFFITKVWQVCGAMWLTGVCIAHGYSRRRLLLVSLVYAGLLRAGCLSRSSWRLDPHYASGSMT